MKYVLLISYDGTEFSGWQRQPGCRTVQETMELAAEQIFGKKLVLTASGRTDAGVHALGQVAQFQAETTIPAEKLAACFNRSLPPDVRVLKSAAAPEGFDCSRSAKRKTYRYSAYVADAELPLLSRFAVQLPKKLDLERMRKASELLLGRHDFRAFRSSGFTSKTSEREIYDLQISEKVQDGVEKYDVEVTGNGFLYNMVRILCGELFAVGAGKEEGFSKALQTGERKLLSKTMPPKGLCLIKVEYGVPLFGTAEDKDQ